MYIRLDVFAEMLGIKPVVLRHAMRTGKGLDGLELPPCRQVRGATVMFNHNDAIAFCKKWHSCSKPPTKPLSDKELIPLITVAERANIAPLALWQAACTGRRLRGVTLPVAAKNCEGTLMFDSDSVEKFLINYRDADLD